MLATLPPRRPCRRIAGMARSYRETPCETGISAWKLLIE
jgi:hypothetical protein